MTDPWPSSSPSPSRGRRLVVEWPSQSSSPTAASFVTARLAMATVARMRFRDGWIHECRDLTRNGVSSFRRRQFLHETASRSHPYISHPLSGGICVENDLGIRFSEFSVDL
ncbi:hypothetical protein TIFTF001_021653 [Ficus carica]|uniref:Uncharacterized protein n=1 Tax=Ficus carica TaxID=3494 RepID=A0AA88DEU9_FICCA|nr:hypothetical protein TIFTF001_021653 [Ficus carica]